MIGEPNAARRRPVIRHFALGQSIPTVVIRWVARDPGRRAHDAPTL